MKRFTWVIVLVTASVLGFFSFTIRNDYGWNWDAYQHFVRGQAYYRIITTGKTEPSNIQPYKGRLGYYEYNPFDLTWITTRIGHPPTTDIILAAVNQIFYKRLGILGDFESYYVYGIFLTFVTAVCVGFWSYQISGWIGGVVTVLAFYGLPLLFAEQHFNFKDPATLAYNTIFLYLFWLGITRKKSIFILFASIIAGISLGTKFNILFLLPVVCFWFFWYVNERIKQFFKKTSLLFNILFWSAPAIMVFLLFCTYPLLWTDFWHNIKNIIDYYRQIGANRCPWIPTTGMWFLRCSDWQTVRLFIVTIPVITLLLSVIGSVAAIITVGTHRSAPLLWLMVVTSIALRVILPVNSLYGNSLRQILEFIGPMSLLAGYGARWLIFRSKRIAPYSLLVCLLYVPVYWTMSVLHPNENLYTNIIAHTFWKNDIPQFVNGIVSYGNAYKQGIDWINCHVEAGSSVSLVTGVDSAIPTTPFRKDLRFGSMYWSGYDQKGEYLMELVNNNGNQTQLFQYKYVSNILEPVYERLVQGFPIIRIWKNDRVHVKQKFRTTSESAILKKYVSKDEVVLELSAAVPLQSLSIMTGSEECRQTIMNSYILVSTDGATYSRMYETVEETNRGNNKDLRYLFAADNGKYIKLFTYAPGTCDLSDVHFSVTSFP